MSTAAASSAIVSASDSRPSRNSGHLDAWAAALGDLLPDSAALASLAQHWALVQQWNSRVNLTAIHDTPTALVRHYRDSLMALPYLGGGPVVDFGSGAGFPGMVLAIARPNWQVTLVEPRRKRVSFLEVVRARLGLSNVRVHHGKLEDAADKAYAHAVTRATFADDGGLLPMVQVQTHAARWLGDAGTLILYRSSPAPRDVREQDARVHGSDSAVHPYTLPAVADSPEAVRALEVWTVPRLRRGAV